MMGTRELEKDQINTTKLLILTSLITLVTIITVNQKITDGNILFRLN